MRDEEGLDLLYKRRKDGCKHEDREDDSLHACKCRVGLVEGETDEETSDGAETKLSHNVTGHAPILLESTVCALHDLRCQWHGELATTGLRCNIEVFMFLGLMELIDLLLNTLGFFARFPDVEPVLTVVVLASVHDLQHVLSRVLIFTTGTCTIVLEVLKKCSGVLAKVAEVDSLTTTGKEEETVELLEENGAGLMDGTKNGLAGIAELAEEGDDRPGTLYRS